GSGVDLEAAGDRDFDFARRQIEDDRDAAASARLASDYALEAGERAGLADKDPEAGGGLSDNCVERLDLLRGQAQALLLAAHIDRDDQQLTGIEQSPHLAQHLREQGHLEHSARVRHLDKGEAIAAGGGAFLAVDDDAGKLEARPLVRRQSRRQLRKADDSRALEALAV